MGAGIGKLKLCGSDDLRWITGFEDSEKIVGEAKGVEDARTEVVGLVFRL